MTAHQTSSWMRFTMWIAGAYHLAWGLWAMVFPLSAFRMAGVAPPNYPEVWQVLGGLIGVYGVAFLAAGIDPVRYWPVIMAGLLAKVLGPVSYLLAASEGRIPWTAGWMVFFHDVVWWIPLGLILHHAYQERLGVRRVHSAEVLKLALRARSQQGETLDDLSRSSPLLLIFLRHMGCPFCREALADLARQREGIERLGTRIAIVHMSHLENAESLLRQNNLQDLHRFSDSKQSLYRAFGLLRGRPLQLVGPKVWLRGLIATVLEKHWPGKVDGDVFQMPGVFLLFHGEVIRSYRHQSAADRPSYLSIAGGGLPELELR